jgi:hypothetical protein
MTGNTVKSRVPIMYDGNTVKSRVPIMYDGKYSQI